MTWLRFAIVIACLPLSCAREPEPRASLSAAGAGRVDEQRRADDLIQRALQAAGGLPRWRNFQDAAFISTLTLFDQRGDPTSETIFLHKLLLGERVRSRLESIGLAEELVFGFDGSADWMLRAGRAVTTPEETAFTRFHARTSSFWFQLPFVLAEPGLQVQYLGEVDRGDLHWSRLRIEGGAGTIVPAEWVDLYFDVATGLIERVVVRLNEEFLPHQTWMGKWRDYREIDGIQRERQRFFYPADAVGEPQGGVAAEQLIEHIRFDNDWPENIFERPLIAGGGSPAG